MAGKKWNNQGGSNFDGFNGKYKKPKEQQNIPNFADLDESNSTSFNYKVPPKPKPKLGAFGDEIWTYEVVDDISPITDLTPKSPRVPSIPESTPNTSIPHADPVNSSLNLFPTSVINEYELVVKFGLLVLRISSGQAYAARQGLNDPRYDFALVIKSSNPISISGNTAAIVNLISVSNSAQNPIYSLYNWLKTKISIATNNNATGADPVLSGIDIVNNVAQLPSTQFVSNSLVCGLFYADGIQPDQICLNAINQVFDFAPSVAANPTWSVTYPGEILPLCLDINRLQIISIKLIPDTLNAINRGSGQEFKLRIARDATIAQLANSLEVDIKITSSELLVFSQQLDPTLYTTTNINNVAIQQISATIPSLATFIDVTIEPLTDPTKLVPVPLKVEIISSWVPDPTPDYSINSLYKEVLMTVDPGSLLPIVNIRIPVTSRTEYVIDPGNFDIDGNQVFIETTVTEVRSSIKQNDGFYTIEVSRSFATPSPLTVFVDLLATVPESDFDFVAPQIPILPGGLVQFVIPANQLSRTYSWFVGQQSFRYQQNNSGTLTIRPFSTYTIGIDPLVVFTVLMRDRRTYSSPVVGGNTFTGGSSVVTFDTPPPNYLLQNGFVTYNDRYKVRIVFSDGSLSDYGSSFNNTLLIKTTNITVPGPILTVSVNSNTSPPSNQEMVNFLIIRGVSLTTISQLQSITSIYQNTSINAIYSDYLEN